MPLRLGYDAKRFFHNFTGLGNYSRNLISGLLANFPEQEYHLYTPKARSHPEVDAIIATAQINIHTASFSPASLWRSLGLARDVHRDGIQLFHGLSHELPPGLKVPSVVTMHDLIYLHSPGDFPWIDRQVYDWKFRHACRVAQGIIAISEQTKSDLIQYFEVAPEKVQVIYQTCHPAFRRAVAPSTLKAVQERHLLPSQYWLSVGSIVPRKNLMRVVEALEATPEADRIPLVVVGSGKKYWSQVQEFARSKALEPWLLHRPEVSHAELPAVYRRATGLIYPSLYEGFGIPLVEALYSEIPAITSNISALPEAGGPGAWYVNPQKSQDIAAAMLEILNNPVEAAERVAAGLAFAQVQFDPARLSRQLMELYNMLMC